MRKDEKVKSTSRVFVKLACGLFLAVLAFASGACDNDSDPTAPADSVITVDANPATVVVIGSVPGSTTITATVRSKNGTRLPDQEVAFSTTAGDFDPNDANPTLTDDQGEATIGMKTDVAATVTARSGSLTGTVQLRTSPGKLTPFILDIDPTEIFNCNETITLTATVQDPNGRLLQGVQVEFDEAMSTITGNFVPNNVDTTDSNGEATADWTPGTQCDTLCKAGGDPNNPSSPGICFLFFIADDGNGGFASAEQEVTDSIP